MSTMAVGWSPASPGGNAKRALRWLCTKNPFYVVSAGLFLAGLWISFGGQANAAETGALMAGLAGYTLLLAGTACFLVRFGKVWDDVRTVLLLVVLMFLATSVTLDDVLVAEPVLGSACFIGGLAFAVAISEAVLRGIRLRLPAFFRVPYYLILAVFFLYPLILRPLVHQPHSEAQTWGLFSFAAVAGAAFLTLLPAIRRGPEYVRDNGSPWPWPLYPWSLFVFLAVAVVGRAFLLCWSLHLLDMRDQNSLIFGPYFLVPFGLALTVLLLELGLVSRHVVTLRVALFAPAAMVVLAAIGHREDPVYQSFLQTFAGRLGGTPLYLTLLAAMAFYLYALVRRVPHATEALTAALAALACIGPKSLAPDEVNLMYPLPLLAAAALQLALSIWRRESWRFLLSAAALAMALAFLVPEETVDMPYRVLIAWHLLLGLLLIVGATFNDSLARGLRALAPILALPTCFMALWSPTPFPLLLTLAYPLVVAAALAAYGRLLRQLPTIALAIALAVCWLATILWRGYFALRLLILGLDYLVVSLAIFAVAIIISVRKSGGLWTAGERE